MSERTKRAASRVRSYSMNASDMVRYMSLLEEPRGFSESVYFRQLAYTRWAARLCFNYIRQNEQDGTIYEKKYLLEKYARILDNWSTIGTPEDRFMFSVAKDTAEDIWDWYDGMEFNRRNHAEH